MSVYDAEPNDIYVDEHGKLWRVVGVIHSPSVIVEEVEPLDGASKMQKSGGVGGYMWHGFKRIHRPEKNAATGHFNQEQN